MGSVDAKTLDSVLVIGGCGYLGSNLVRFLLEEPTCSSVHVMSRNPVNNIHQRAIYHVGDVSSRYVLYIHNLLKFYFTLLITVQILSTPSTKVLDQHILINPSDQVATLLEKIKPKVIFHTASPKYTDTEKTLRRTNIDGTNVLLKSALASPAVKALVYTSTDSAIVQKPGHLLTEETAELYTEKSNVSAYAKTKAIADAMVLGANSLNLHTAVIRIPGLYGPNDDNCMGSLLKSLKKGQQKVQVGNNDKHFEFVYVDSACAAHILAAKALTSPDQESAVFKVDGEAFFISDGASLPYFDFARKVYAFAGHPVLKEDIQIIRKSKPRKKFSYLGFIHELKYCLIRRNRSLSLKKLPYPYESVLPSPKYQNN